MRQIVLDTETTGLELTDGHRIIEIGCVELMHRRPSGRTWQRYLQPERVVEAGALAVHGITNEFLASQPRFAEVAGEFLEFIEGAELVIHNAPFDVGFLDAELGRAGIGRTIGETCRVLDTLVVARQLHPGQRNSLDALCKRYGVDNSRRDLHGALLDARILVDVYLAMTGGQAALTLDGDPATADVRTAAERRQRGAVRIPVIRANAQELAAHGRSLEAIERASNGEALFRATDRRAGEG
jgi:DNA polymerase-3 subunit epsilon